MNKNIIIVILALIIAVGGIFIYKKCTHQGCHFFHKTSAVQEHAGQEHAGQEHPGAPSSSKEFTANEIKSTMTSYIQALSQNHGGSFKIMDEKTKQALTLKFVKIHDPVRKIEGKGYFACIDFEVVGTPGKLYDLDFWLNPQANQLVVTDTKIHKEPTLEKGQWVKKERYTFVNDNPVEVK
ncbi:MAG TPA: hypothetical protein DD708_08845 [Deltaproteobacteria bacterium]|nr:MAG: hypothetical protein A3A72_08755 [Deltaproteobacteria bacterium RIFCSPLOWO2_01_FULL_38_9]HBQ22024.1 hypothetical protein [Deltaproteobacteria bacterium]